MSKEQSAGIFQLENGYWGYRFIVTVDGKRKAQKRVKDEMGKPYKTEKQAIKAREKAITMEKTRMLLPPQKKIVRKTVEDVYKEYCEKGRSEKAYATKKKQDSLWNNYLLERFGDRYIDDITVAEVNDYLAELYCVYHFAYGYVEGFLKQFYLIFGQAYSRNYLSIDDYNKLCVNKNGKIRMPARKSTDVHDIEAFTKEELKTMDKYFSGKPVETAYIIGKNSGLRIAECYGLTWDCIDLDNGIITVEKQMKTQDGLVKLLPLKTVNARRKVYMSTELKNYLTNLKEKVKEYEVEFAAQRQQNEMFILNVDGEKISSLELVNTLPNGKIQTEWAIKHHARPLKEHYKIEFKFHTLRHTYGTTLAMLNTPSHVLANQMGHGKNSSAFKYYLAMSKEGIDELRSNLDRM